MKLFIRVYALVLLIYTGWRTFDFISSTLPKDDLSFWLSLAFLFAAEAGLAAWHEIALKHVTTESQQTTAKIMTWLDFVASLAAGIADMILRQTFVEGYAVPTWLAQLLIYGLPAVMAANVAAIILYEQADSETQLNLKKKQVQFKIYTEAMKELDAAAEEIARDKKIPIYRSLRDEVTGQVDKKYGIPPQNVSSTPKPEEHAQLGQGSTEIKVLSSSNGKTPEAANFTNQQPGK